MEHKTKDGTQWISLGLALLLLLLSAAAQNPALHAWLHAWDAPSTECAHAPGEKHQDQQHNDASCAVSLFANGLTSFEAPSLESFALLRCLEMRLPAAEEQVRKPSLRGTPSCGPPVA